VDLIRSNTFTNALEHYAAQQGLAATVPAPNHEQLVPIWMERDLTKPLSAYPVELHKALALDLSIQTKIAQLSKPIGEQFVRYLSQYELEYQTDILEHLKRYGLDTTASSFTNLHVLTGYGLEAAVLTLPGDVNENQQIRYALLRPFLDIYLEIIYLYDYLYFRLVLSEHPKEFRAIIQPIAENYTVPTMLAIIKALYSSVTYSPEEYTDLAEAFTVEKGYTDMDSLLKAIYVLENEVNPRPFTKSARVYLAHEAAMLSLISEETKRNWIQR
jgi:hypothetical protein